MRRLFSIAFFVLAFVVATLKIAEWTSEEWWMNSMGYRSAQALYWQWRVEAFIPAFLVWTGVLLSNARLAWHNARWLDGSLPLLGPRALTSRSHISPEDRVRLELLAKRGEQIFIGLSAVLCGMAAANQFDLWVLMFHPPTFGALESGADATFLVGVWPALLWVWNAFGALLGFTLGMVITIAAFEGVLDFDTHGLRVGDATARHLAFLVGLMVVWVGVRCGLSALGEPVNFGWSANGISGFYERTFTNPTRVFFVVSSIPLAFWFARMAPRDALRPVMVTVFWMASAVFLPLMAPSFGRAMVATSPTLDATLRIEQTQHLAVTRKAWGLDQVQKRRLNVAASDFGVSVAQPVASVSKAEKTPGLVVWPQEALRSALHENDTGRGTGSTGKGRRASELYIGREGNALKARVIETDPAKTVATSPLVWESDPSRSEQVVATRRELQAVILQSPVERNAVSTRTPTLAPNDDNLAAPSQARVREVEKNARGVTRTNSLTNFALALRFGDHSLLEGDKPVTWHLDPLERVQTLAPFVWWTDAQPHPVWMPVGSEKSERLFWLVEGCFVSRSYPHAAMIQAGDEWSNVNYARQSVLGVCDASTGETSFFLFAPNEPFSRAWAALLPGFFRPLRELPAPLRAGTRLSVGLLNAQTTLWERYHPVPTGQDGDEAQEWNKGTDNWRQFGTFDSSERNMLVEQVLVERNGKAGLELVAAFASSRGTLADNYIAGTKQNPTPMVAMMSARDEGEAIWAGKGRSPISTWRASKPLQLPFTESSSGVTPATPFPPEYFDKFAMVPLLDKAGDCVGMQLSLGRAGRRSNTTGYAPWILSNNTASTRTQFIASVNPASSAQTAAKLAQLRARWKSWQEARKEGRWEQVEALEKEISRLLGP
ncbi:hypothetical protein EON83_23865 [bacterium]|nr:MAG: hypothetical protein EON83_23865 [bacterium]